MLNIFFCIHYFIDNNYCFIIGGQVSNKITKQTKLIEDNKSLKNIKGNETKLYIEKKKELKKSQIY